MLTENQKKWVAALRSGEYKQGVGSLKSEGCHCCLGVVCEVYEKETGDNLPKNSEGEYMIETDLCQELAYSLGCSLELERVQSWLGLKTSCGFIAETRESLVSLNDQEGKTFDQIANFIENRHEDLFV